LTAAPDAGFDFADMPRNASIDQPHHALCGLEVYGIGDDALHVLEAVLSAPLVE
jgi:hypothetical protein